MANNENTMCEEIHGQELYATSESTSEEILTAGLGNNSRENSRFAAAFWEVVWPQLQENGWERRVRTGCNNKNIGTTGSFLHNLMP